MTDIADVHFKALDYLLEQRNKKNPSFFNLDTGRGVSVLEVIRAFEKVSGKKLEYKVGRRREGDVVAVYANNDCARMELGWVPKFGLEDMMSSAWKWQLRLEEEDKR